MELTVCGGTAAVSDMAVLPLLGVDVEAINKFIPIFSKAGCGLSHLAAAQCLLAAHDQMGFANCFTSTLRGWFRRAAPIEDTSTNTVSNILLVFLCPPGPPTL